MHFATPRSLIAMVLAWAVFLVAYDQHANPRPVATYWAEFKGSSTRPTVVSEGDTPRVRLSMPHLCCTGCVSDIRAALLPLSWLAPTRLATEPPAVQDAEGTAEGATTAHEIEFDILDVTKANFVTLDRALSDTGLVPDRIEVFGMGHFRLEVELPHLCCTVCSRAVDEQLERLLRKETQGRWLDSVSMNHVKKTVTIYARLNAVVDLVEVTRALEHAGFSAQAIRVRTGPES
jgi:copper chaperone CopZ